MISIPLQFLQKRPYQLIAPAHSPHIDNMENIGKWNVARKYEQRALLIAVNCVAGLSIFFFGYDQGVMGGVNNDRSYATTMGFGYYDDKAQGVNVTRTLLQGGIVSLIVSPVWGF